MNKDICKRCMEKGWGELGWNANDELRWERGVIACPKNLSGSEPRNLLNDRHNLLEDGVPPGCHYALEQLVMNQ